MLHTDVTIGIQQFQASLEIFKMKPGHLSCCGEIPMNRPWFEQSTFEISRHIYAGWNLLRKSAREREKEN
jgi:hypothetical protein